MSSEERFPQDASGLVPPRTWLNHPLLLPVCCICGLIRDDVASTPAHACWITLASYRSRHQMPSTDLVFTHTYCPDCLTQVQERVRQYFNEQRAQR